MTTETSQQENKKGNDRTSCRGAPISQKDKEKTNRSEDKAAAERYRAVVECVLDNKSDDSESCSTTCMGEEYPTTGCPDKRNCNRYIQEEAANGNHNIAGPKQQGEEAPQELASPQDQDGQDEDGAPSSSSDSVGPSWTAAKHSIIKQAARYGENHAEARDSSTTTSAMENDTCHRAGAFAIGGILSPPGQDDGPSHPSPDPLNDENPTTTSLPQEQEQFVITTARLVEEDEEENQILLRMEEQTAKIKKKILQEATQAREVHLFDNEEAAKNAAVVAKRQFLTGAIVALFVFVVVSVAIVVGVLLPMNNDKEAISGLSDYDYMVQVLHPDLQDENSSSYQAFRWLTLEDTWFNTTVQNVPFQVLMDRFVLAVLYFATGGPFWTKSFDFLSNTSACEWHDQIFREGVYCETGEEVSHIWIGRVGLDGTLPSELGDLKLLESIGLFDYGLHGAIPSELGELKQLTSIAFTHSSLTGSIPESFGQSGMLQWLAMYSNMLTGSLPTRLTQLPFKDILLYDNSLTGSIPDVSFNGYLEHFEVDANNLVGTIPELLYTMANLKSLNLAANSFEGALSTSIGKLTRLEVLALFKNKFDGTIPTQLGLLRALKYLDLAENGFNGTIPTEFGKLRNVAELYLLFNNLIGPIPADLGDMDELRQIWLTSNPLTGTIPSELTRLSGLGKRVCVQ